MKALRIVLVALVGLVALLFLSEGQPVDAATITVNTTDDELNADGDCSLREAIQAANTDAAVDTCPAGSGADTITLLAGTYTLSIAGAGEDANATGDLDITGDLTITGAGAATTIIDGAHLDRVLQVVGVTVQISGVTIRNGSSDGYGGGICNYGTLILNSSTISGNVAARGGGIYNAGMLTLNTSSVNGNTAAANIGGGIFNEGGTLILNSSSVSGNTNGGIVHFGGTLTLNSSTVSGNTNFRGIQIIQGTATLTNSTVSGNTINGSSAGISNGGTLTLTNSTVSGNSARDSGGGIGNGRTLTLNSSTVSGNSAGVGGGINNDSHATSTLKNTIVADNSTDCAGSITSAGHNLSSDGTCSFTAPGDLMNTDPVLAPLANNGGPTQTHALLAGSPAIEVGSPDCPPPATDQRGVGRPQGAACDIGAFEAPLPVGGIAQLPDVSHSPARNYGALAGAALTALVAVTAAAWYARRRFSRG